MQTDESVRPDGSRGPRKPDFEAAVSEFGRPVFVAAGSSIGGWEVEQASVGLGHTGKNARRLFTVSHRSELGLVRVTTVHPDTQSALEDVAGGLMFAWAVENSDADIQDFEHVEELGQPFGHLSITPEERLIVVDNVAYSADRYDGGGVELLFVNALQVFIAGGHAPPLTTWKTVALAT